MKGCKHIYVAILIVIIIAMFPQISIYGERISLSENEVQYTFFSLPDGESLLITTGLGKRILINTGSTKSEDELLSQLDQLEIKKIDALIITSARDDMCGNAEVLIKKYKIQSIISHQKSNCIGENTNENIEIWKSGKVYELSPGLLFRVLKVDDSDSMSLFILFGNNSLLFMSEASEKLEELIRNFPSRIEMLKIPEYGLKNFPSSQMLEYLNPHLAIVYNIQERQLHDGLLERLNESWIDIYHLKTLGTIHIFCTPGNYEIKK